MSCAPSTIGLSDLLERFGAGIRRADDDRADEVARQRAVGADERERRGDRPRAQADRETPDDVPGAQDRVKIRRSGMHPCDARSDCRGARTAPAPRPACRAGAGGCRPTARQRPAVRGAPAPPAGRNAKWLSTCASVPSSPARAISAANARSCSSWWPAQTSRPRDCARSSRPARRRRQRERLLDVDVSAAVERRARGLEMRGRRCADVHDIRAGPRPAASPPSESRRVRPAPRTPPPSQVPVVARRRRLRRAPPTALQMLAGHLAGADECNTKRSDRHWMRYSANARADMSGDRERQTLPDSDGEIGAPIRAGRGATFPRGPGMPYQKSGSSSAPH